LKYQNILAPIAAALTLTLAPLASHASLVLRITDGADTVSIQDGGALDNQPAPDAVGFTGSFKGWNLTTSVGTSGADPLAMHFTAFVVGDKSSGKIWLELTDTDLLAGLGLVGLSASGVGFAGNVGIQGSWAGYVDDSNALFGTATSVFSSSGFGAAGGTASVPLSDTYSASLVTSFDYGGSTTDSLQGSSFDVRMDVLSVAEPTSVALVGLALLGLGVARRRKDCLFRQ